MDLSIYNILHLIVNIIIVIQLLKKTNKKLIVILLYLIHLFHIIFYKLKIDEYIHHILTFIAIPLVLTSNVNNKYIKPLLFFIIGFPGIINYFVKVLYNFNKITKVNKNNIIKIVNRFIRSPGIITSCIHILINNKIDINMFLVIIMAIIDAVYYFI